MKSGVKVNYQHSYKFALKCGNTVKFRGPDQQHTVTHGVKKILICYCYHLFRTQCQHKS